MPCRLLALLSDDLLLHVLSFLPVGPLARLALSNKGLAGHVRALVLAKRWMNPFDAVEIAEERLREAWRVVIRGAAAARKQTFRAIDHAEESQEILQNLVKECQADSFCKFDLHHRLSYLAYLCGKSIDTVDKVTIEAMTNAFWEVRRCIVARFFTACTADMAPVDLIKFAQAASPTIKNDVGISGASDRSEIWRSAVLKSLRRAQWTPEQAIDLSEAVDLPRKSILISLKKTIARLTTWTHSETLTPKDKAQMLHQYANQRYWEFVDGVSEDVEYSQDAVDARYEAQYEEDDMEIEVALNRATHHLQLCQQIKPPILVVLELVTKLIAFDDDRHNTIEENANNERVPDYERYLTTRKFITAYFTDFDFTSLTAAEREAVLSHASTSEAVEVRHDFLELSLRCIQQISSRCAEHTSLADVSHLCEVALKK